MTAQLHAPGPPIRWGPVHLVKHWWWWQRHTRATRIGRGDLRILATVLPEQPAPRHAQPVRVLDLRCDYPDLIHAAASADLWVQRFRRTRRRTRISTTPPPRPFRPVGYS